MTFISFLAFLTFVVLIIAIPPGYIQYKPGACSFALKSDFYPPHLIKHPILFSPSSLPTNFSWDDQNGISLITSVRNQFLPHSCGSCWAISAIGALSDRLRIQQWRNSNNERLPHAIDLSPQLALDICQENSGLGIYCGSCNGGNVGELYRALSITGISDESCNPYQGFSTSYWNEIGYESYLCHNCNRFGVCQPIPANPDLWFFVDEYGVIREQYYIDSVNASMVEVMKQEIYNRGPIVCNMYAHADSFEDYTGGILVDDNTYPGTTHDIVLLGWAQTMSGLQYWIGRNSFGTQWGGSQQGFFYAQMGINIYNMEHTCYWATIKQHEQLVVINHIA